MRTTEYTAAFKTALGVGRRVDNDSVENWLTLMKEGRQGNHDEKWAICVLANWFPPEWNARVESGQVIMLETLQEAAQPGEWRSSDLPQSDSNYLGYLDDDFDSNEDDDYGVGVTSVAYTQLYSRQAEKLRDELEAFYIKNEKRLVTAAAEHYLLKVKKKEQLN